MNHVHTFCLCDGDNRFNIKICCNRAFTLTYKISFISFKTVNTKTVFFGVYSYGFEIKFIRGAKNSNGNFTAISDKKFFSLME